ncbi:MAG: T9SS type A sorting domain-containing protein [bacterium]|nr:T9SS type A sorting domain-containing protein [bacterium]
MKKFCLIVTGLFMFAKMSYGQVIDSVGDVGKYTSLCMHYTGVYHQYFSNSGFAGSYYDVTNGNLKFINDLGMAPGYWDMTQPIIVDSVGDVGQFTSIAAWFDSLGDSTKESILIAYYDVTNGDLKCAWRRKYLSDTFNLSIIDSSGDVGQFTSIYVDTLNKVPYISYYDVTNRDLKLAYFKDSAWVIQKVDTAGDVGSHSSIDGFIDTICISYYDSTNGDLKLARYNGANLQIEKVDTAGDIGEYSSMYVSSWGCIYGVTIYYYDVTNGDLKKASKNKDSLNWQSYKIDSVGDVGMFINKTKGTALWNLLFYYDKTNGDLRCIGWWDPTDSAGDVGGYISGVDFLGGMMVIYYDFTKGDLKMFRYFEVAVEEFKLVETDYNLSLSQNPFSHSTVISFSVGNSRDCSLNIYDIAGKLVKTFPITQLPNNQITYVTWNGTDNNANDLKTGIYFLTLSTGASKTTKKLTIIR